MSEVSQPNELIETIEKALEAATPGPWLRSAHDDSDTTTWDVWAERHVTKSNIVAYDILENDFNLIANAPEWLRALLEENKLLRESKLNIEHNRTLLSAELQQTREELERTQSTLMEVESAKQLFHSQWWKAREELGQVSELQSIAANNCEKLITELEQVKAELDGEKRAGSLAAKHLIAVSDELSAIKQIAQSALDGSLDDAHEALTKIVGDTHD